MYHHFRPSEIIRDRYRLKERIGQGGYSVVWLTEDIAKNNAQVALKIYVPNQGLGDQDLKLFEKEYRITQSLNDARLLKATDYFVWQESPCLVFPFMAGGSLQELIEQEGPLPEATIAKLIYQIGGALNYLHSQHPHPILHLDIKPENILLDYAGNFILSDFGISSNLRMTLMRASNVKGETMTYKAPERVLGQPAGTPVDIFALGVTVYECCNGLLDGNFLPGFNIAKDIPVQMTIDKQKYSPELEKVISFCINGKPDQRPPASMLEEEARYYLDNGRWNAAPKTNTAGRKTVPVNTRTTVPVRKEPVPPKPIPAQQPTVVTQKPFLRPLTIWIGFFLLLGTTFTWLYQSEYWEEITEVWEGTKRYFSGEELVEVPENVISPELIFPQKGLFYVIEGEFSGSTQAFERVKNIYADYGMQSRIITLSGAGQIKYSIVLGDFKIRNDAIIFMNEQKEKFPGIKIIKG